MTTLYTHQDSNTHKTWLLMSIFLAIIIALGYFLSAWYRSPAILYVAVIFSVVMNIISYWYSDRIVLSMSGAHEADEKEYRDLHNIVENLSITAGLPKPKVFIIEDAAPNAFATGRNKEHAVVAVTTGILGILTKTELEGVIAHELSHVGNRDMLLSTVVVILVGFISILSDMFTRSLLWGGRDNDEREGNSMSGIFMIIGIALTILSPIIATLIQLSISRKREFLADASGALLTRYPEGLASALEKISKYDKPMLRASNATAHLFLSDPFGTQDEEKVSFIRRAFMTHPPIYERIKALRGE